MQASKSNQIIALLVAVFFALTSIPAPQGWAASQVAETSGLDSKPKRLIKVGNLEIPKNLGEIAAFYQGKSPQTVLILQDAHAIPEAQRNLQGLIEYFQSHYGVSLTGLEGSSEELDTKIFEAFPEPKKLRQLFEVFFEKGEMTGGTAAAVFGSEKARYVGVEDWPLYEQALELYLKASEVQAKNSTALDDWKKDLNQREQKIFSAQLLNVTQVLREFEQNQADLSGVLKILAAIKAPEKGSQIETLLKFIELEGVDQGADEVRVRAIAENIKKRGAGRWTMDTTQEFNQEYQAFQTGKISVQTFALYLQTVPGSATLQSELSLIAGDQKKIRDIEGTNFLDEFESYAAQVKGELYRNDTERALDQEGSLFTLFEKLNKLELSHREWQSLRSWVVENPAKDEGSDSTSKEIVPQGSNPQGKDKTGIIISGVKTSVSVAAASQNWADFSVTTGLGLQRSVVTQSKSLQTLNLELPALFKTHFEFYENAQARDGVLLKNLLQWMNSGEPHSAAMLVAGGFHSQGLKQRLKEQGISYALIRPQLKGVPEQTAYGAQMAGRVSWRSYFKVERGHVSVYKAFVRYVRDQLLTGDDGRGTRDGQMQESHSRLTTHDPRLLKAWRDEVLRSLAKKNQLERAGEYTYFFDELASQKKLMETNSLAKADHFFKELRALVADHKLTSQSFYDLLKSVPNLPAGLRAAPIATVVPGALSTVAAAKSEMRASLLGMGGGEMSQDTRHRSQVKATIAHRSASISSRSEVRENSGGSKIQSLARLSSLGDTLEDELLRVYQLNREDMEFRGYTVPPEFNDDVAFMEAVDRLKQWSFAITDNQGEIVGFVLNDAYTPAGWKYLEVALMVVDPSVRGEGYGSRLLDASEKLAQKLGKTGLWLEVGVDNISAIGLYERFGFKRKFKPRQAFFGTHYLPMIKKMDSPPKREAASTRSEVRLPKGQKPKGDRHFLAGQAPGSFQRSEVRAANEALQELFLVALNHLIQAGPIAWFSVIFGSLIAWLLLPKVFARGVEDRYLRRLKNLKSISARDGLSTSQVSRNKNWRAMFAILKKYETVYLKALYNERHGYELTWNQQRRKKEVELAREVFSGFQSSVQDWALSRSFRFYNLFNRARFKRALRHFGKVPGFLQDETRVFLAGMDKEPYSPWVRRKAHGVLTKLQKSESLTAKPSSTRSEVRMNGSRTTRNVVPTFQRSEVRMNEIERRDFLKSVAASMTVVSQARGVQPLLDIPNAADIIHAFAGGDLVKTAAAFENMPGIMTKLMAMITNVAIPDNSSRPPLDSIDHGAARSGRAQYDILIKRSISPSLIRLKGEQHQIARHLAQLRQLRSQQPIPMTLLSFFNESLPEDKRAFLNTLSLGQQKAFLQEALSERLIRLNELLVKGAGLMRKADEFKRTANELIEQGVKILKAWRPPQESAQEELQKKWQSIDQETGQVESRVDEILKLIEEIRQIHDYRARLLSGRLQNLETFDDPVELDDLDAEADRRTEKLEGLIDSLPLIDSEDGLARQQGEEASATGHAALRPQSAAQNIVGQGPGRPVINPPTAEMSEERRIEETEFYNFFKTENPQGVLVIAGEDFDSEGNLRSASKDRFNAAMRHGQTFILDVGSLVVANTKYLEGQQPGASLRNDDRMEDVELRIRHIASAFSDLVRQRKKTGGQSRADRRPYGMILRELLKNAITHGNGLDFTLPVAFKLGFVGEELFSMEVFDHGSRLDARRFPFTTKALGGEKAFYDREILKTDYQFVGDAGLTIPVQTVFDRDGSAIHKVKVALSEEFVTAEEWQPIISDILKVQGLLKELKPYVGSGRSDPRHFGELGVALRNFLGNELAGIQGRSGDPAEFVRDLDLLRLGVAEGIEALNIAAMMLEAMLSHAAGEAFELPEALMADATAVKHNDRRDFVNYPKNHAVVFASLLNNRRHDLETVRETLSAMKALLENLHLPVSRSEMRMDATQRALAGVEWQKEIGRFLSDPTKPLELFEAWLGHLFDRGDSVPFAQIAPNVQSNVIKVLYERFSEQGLPQGVSRQKLSGILNQVLRDHSPAKDFGAEGLTALSVIEMKVQQRAEMQQQVEAYYGRGAGLQLGAAPETLKESSSTLFFKTLPSILEADSPDHPLVQSKFKNAIILLIGPAAVEIKAFLTAYPEVKEIHVVNKDLEQMKALDQFLNKAQAQTDTIPGFGGAAGRKLPAFYGYQTNALELPLDLSVDAVFDAAALDDDYYSEGQTHQLMYEIFRVLKLGGIFSTSIPANAQRFFKYAKVWMSSEPSRAEENVVFSYFIKDSSRSEVRMNERVSDQGLSPSVVEIPEWIEPYLVAIPGGADSHEIWLDREFVAGLTKGFASMPEAKPVTLGGSAALYMLLGAHGPLLSRPLKKGVGDLDLGGSSGIFLKTKKSFDGFKIHSIQSGVLLDTHFRPSLWNVYLNFVPDQSQPQGFRVEFFQPKSAFYDGGEYDVRHITNAVEAIRRGEIEETGLSKDLSFEVAFRILKTFLLSDMTLSTSLREKMTRVISFTREYSESRVLWLRDLFIQSPTYRRDFFMIVNELGLKDVFFQGLTKHFVASAETQFSTEPWADSYREEYLQELQSAWAVFLAKINDANYRNLWFAIRAELTEKKLDLEVLQVPQVLRQLQEDSSSVVNDKAKSEVRTTTLVTRPAQLATNTSAAGRRETQRSEVRSDASRPTANLQADDARAYAAAFDAADFIHEFEGGVYSEAQTEAIAFLYDYDVDKLLHDFSMLNPGDEQYKRTVVALSFNDNLQAYARIKDYALRLDFSTDLQKIKDLGSVLQFIQFKVLTQRGAGDGEFKHINRRTWAGRQDLSYEVIDPVVDEAERKGEDIIFGDFAVSDGTSTYELASRYQNRSVKVKVIGYDRVMGLYFFPWKGKTYVFNDSDEWVQMLENGKIAHMPLSRESGAVQEVKTAFLAISFDEKQRIRTSLLSPEVEFFMQAHPDLLEFKIHDVFTPMPSDRKHRFIRVSGLLMRLYSYFSDTKIKEALSLIGDSLEDQGVLMNGSFWNDEGFPDGTYDVFRRQNNFLELIGLRPPHNETLTSEGWEKIPLRLEAQAVQAASESKRSEVRTEKDDDGKAITRMFRWEKKGISVNLISEDRSHTREQLDEIQRQLLDYLDALPVNPITQLQALAAAKRALKIGTMRVQFEKKGGAVVFRINNNLSGDFVPSVPARSEKRVVPKLSEFKELQLHYFSGVALTLKGHLNGQEYYIKINYRPILGEREKAVLEELEANDKLSGFLADPLIGILGVENLEQIRPYQQEILEARQNPRYLNDPIYRSFDFKKLPDLLAQITPDSNYIVMKAAPGKSMEDHFNEAMTARNQLKFDETLLAGLKALEVMHQEGVFHRDLTAKEIFYEPESHKITILDWHTAVAPNHSIEAMTAQGLHEIRKQPRKKHERLLGLYGFENISQSMTYDLDAVLEMSLLYYHRLRSNDALSTRFMNMRKADMAPYKLPIAALRQELEAVLRKLGGTVDEAPGEKGTERPRRSEARTSAARVTLDAARKTLGTLSPELAEFLVDRQHLATDEELRAWAEQGTFVVLQLGEAEFERFVRQQMVPGTIQVSPQLADYSVQRILKNFAATRSDDRLEASVTLGFDLAGEEAGLMHVLVQPVIQRLVARGLLSKKMDRAVFREVEGINLSVFDPAGFGHRPVLGTDNSVVFVLTQDKQAVGIKEYAAVLQHTHGAAGAGLEQETFFNGVSGLVETLAGAVASSVKEIATTEDLKNVEYQNKIKSELLRRLFASDLEGSELKESAQQQLFKFEQDENGISLQLDRSILFRIVTEIYAQQAIASAA